MNGDGGRPAAGLVVRERWGGGRDGDQLEAERSRVGVADVLRRRGRVQTDARRRRRSTCRCRVTGGIACPSAGADMREIDDRQSVVERRLDQFVSLGCIATSSSAAAVHRMPRGGCRLQRPRATDSVRRRRGAACRLTLR